MKTPKTGKVIKPSREPELPKITKRERIKDELLAIQDANRDGVFHPEEAHSWAKSNPKSALHASLEWDDRKAGYNYRLWQIRALVKYTVITEQREPMMVSLSIDRGNGGGYRTVTDVAKDRNLTQVMLNDALSDLERAQRRWERVAGLEKVWKEVERVRARQAGQGKARRGVAELGAAGMAR